jgi:tetratricopeptide (TPR) repeat protein
LEKARTILLEAGEQKYRREACTVICQIAVLCKKQGDNMKAKGLFEEAIEIYESVGSDGSPQVAFFCEQLATIEHELGDHEKDVRYARKACSILIETVGERHTKVADCKYLIGDLFLQHKEHYFQAIEYLQDALLLYERNIDGVPLKCRHSLVKLAEVCILVERYEEARHYIDRLTQLVARHPNDLQEAEAAEAHYFSALLFSKTGDAQRGLDQLQEALGQQRDANLLIHPLSAKIFELFGVLYRAVGDQNRSISAHKEAFRIWCELKGEQSLQAALSVMNLGKALLDAGNMEKADFCLRPALDILTTLLGAEAPETLTAAEYVKLLPQIGPPMPPS